MPLVRQDSTDLLGVQAVNQILVLPCTRLPTHGTAAIIGGRPGCTVDMREKVHPSHVA